MGWWQALLSVETPPGASLHGVEPSLREVLPLVFTLAVTLGGAALAVFLYLLESRKLTVTRRLLLALTRTSAIGLLACLVFWPVQCVAVFKGERPRGVAVLIDNSQSMQQKDRRLTVKDRLRVALALDKLPLTTNIDAGGLDVPSDVPSDPPRIDLARAVLTHPGLDWRQSLRKYGPFRAFLFGSGLKQIPYEAGEGEDDPFATRLTATEPRTALADALDELLFKGEGDPPAAVVLVTDGVDNASKMALTDAARECQRLGVALHVYGVGSPEAGIIQIREVTSPEALFVGDVVAVPVRWLARGIGGKGTVEVALTVNGKEVAREDVAATDGEDLRRTLTFKPTKELAREGKSDLAVKIRLKGSDLYGDELNKAVQIIDRKVKVLYVENSPRWDFKFLMMNLFRDSQDRQEGQALDPKFILVNGDAEAMSGGPPFLSEFPKTRKELFEYDLLILGDVPASYLGAEKIGWIREFVLEGRGLIHIAGKMHGPSSWHGTLLGDLLPVEYQPMRNPSLGDVRTTEYHPKLTPVGERSELMMLGDTREDNLKIWETMPGWYWYYPSTKVRPSAITLLAHPEAKAGDDPMPLICMHHAGKGLVIYLASDETWRWRYNQQDRYFARFWGQLLYVAGMSRSQGNRQTQLALERSEVQLGRPGQVFARLFDGDYKPIVQKSVTARLENLDVAAGEGRVQNVEMLPVPGRPGEYRAVLANDRAGRYRLKVSGSEPGELQYRVSPPPQHELAVSALAEDSLRAAARDSGGAYYREEDLGKLAGAIEPRKAAFLHRTQVLPWNALAFLVFVGLLTTEWIVRKFSNLS